MGWPTDHEPRRDVTMAAPRASLRELPSPGHPAACGERGTALPQPCMPDRPTSRVALVIGTRPEAIKLAPVYEAIRAHPALEPLVLSTAQHREMLRDQRDQGSGQQSQHRSIGRDPAPHRKR